MAELRNVSPGSKARAAEKKASAKLRGRQKFDDQSNVNKLYRWIQKGVKSVEAGFPAQTKGGTYTHQEPRD